MNTFSLSFSGDPQVEGSHRKTTSLLHLTNDEAFDVIGSTMSMKRKSPPHSKTDLAILSVLWRKGKENGREIFDELIATKDVLEAVAYTTIKYVRDPQRLRQSKVLNDPPGVYVYAANVIREEIMERHEVLKHVIDSLPDAICDYPLVRRPAEAHRAGYWLS
jgi:predicted transcriptional regulator